MISKSFIAYACLLGLTTSINAQPAASGVKGGHAKAHKHGHGHHHTHHHARDAVSDTIEGRNFALPYSHVGVEGFPVHAGPPYYVEARDLEALADRSHGRHRKHKSHSHSHSTSSTSHHHAARGHESFAEHEHGKGEEEWHNLLRRLEDHLSHEHEDKSHSHSSTSHSQPSHSHKEHGPESHEHGKGEKHAAEELHKHLRSLEVHLPHHHKHKSHSHSHASTSHSHKERDLQAVVNEVNKLGSGEKWVGSHLFARSPKVHRPHHHKHKSSSHSSTSHHKVERDLQAVVNEVNKLGNGEKWVGSHLFARSPKVHRPHHHKHKSSSHASTSHHKVGRGLESFAEHEHGKGEKYVGEELHNLMRRLRVDFGHGQPFPAYTPGEYHAVGFRDLDGLDARELADRDLIGKLVHVLKGRSDDLD